MFCLNLNDISFITGKGFDYHCILYEITKSEAIHLFENTVLEDRGYIQKYMSGLAWQKEM